MHLAVGCGGPLFGTVEVVVTLPWTVPALALWPADLAERWGRYAEKTFMPGNGLLLMLPLYRWLRRTQGEYLARPMRRAEFRGRSYLSALVPCRDVARIAEAVAEANSPVKPEAEPMRTTLPQGSFARGCGGCGRRAEGAFGAGAT